MGAEDEIPLEGAVEGRCLVRVRAVAKVLHLLIAGVQQVERIRELPLLPLEVHPPRYPSHRHTSRGLGAPRAASRPKQKARAHVVWPRRSADSSTPRSLVVLHRDASYGK
jgi:hypothetical protein